MSAKALITSAIFLSSYLVLTSGPLEAQFLKNLKEKAESEIEKRSGKEQNNEEIDRGYLVSENAIETIDDFVAIYNSYAAFPEIKSDFEEAEALLQEYFEHRSVLCDNELYAMDDDGFYIYADLRPKTGLARLDEELNKHFESFWPYIWGLQSEEKSIKMITRGNSHMNEAEWQEDDGYSKSEILNGKQFRAEGEISSELTYTWRAFEDKGSWSTVGSFGYRLMKENDAAEIRPYNATGGWFKTEVDNWHSTEWNQRRSQIPVNFASMTKDDRCTALNKIATSN